MKTISDIYNSPLADFSRSMQNTAAYQLSQSNLFIEAQRLSDYFEKNGLFQIVKMQQQLIDSLKANSPMLALREAFKESPTQLLHKKINKSDQLTSENKEVFIGPVRKKDILLESFNELNFKVDKLIESQSKPEPKTEPFYKLKERLIDNGYDFIIQGFYLYVFVQLWSLCKDLIVFIYWLF